MPIQSHYSDFAVLKQEQEWDPHTRKIVRSRVGPFGAPKALDHKQVKTLASILSQMVADDRPEILEYLIDHLDRQTTSPIGQSERKQNIPPFSQLLSIGLDQLDDHSEQHHGRSYGHLTPDEQQYLLQSVSTGALPAGTNWEPQHQREFFTQLLSQTVSAYYSHPWVWSEIGYAGPAYPRGYMRIELGLTEPWEAKRHGE